MSAVFGCTASVPDFVIVIVVPLVEFVAVLLLLPSVSEKRPLALKAGVNLNPTLTDSLLVWVTPCEIVIPLEV